MTAVANTVTLPITRTTTRPIKKRAHFIVAFSSKPHDGGFPLASAFDVNAYLRHAFVAVMFQKLHIRGEGFRYEGALKEYIRRQLEKKK